tara:strand:+ start:78 stop:299 length:222 start_codon:yes stop_codon:yes gene_type:complete
MEVIKTHDLHPDGVRVVVNWSGMVVGSSLFVPCINTHKALKQVKELFAEFGWKHTAKVVVNNSKLGVRIWRTL